MNEVIHAKALSFFFSLFILFFFFKDKKARSSWLCAHVLWIIAAIIFIFLHLSYVNRTRMSVVYSFLYGDCKCSLFGFINLLKIARLLFFLSRGLPAAVFPYKYVFFFRCFSFVMAKKNQPNVAFSSN